MHVWSSEMDNRSTYSACRGILLVCRGLLHNVVGNFLYVAGYFLTS